MCLRPEQEASRLSAARRDSQKGRKTTSQVSEKVGKHFHKSNSWVKNRSRCNSAFKEHFVIHNISQIYFSSTSTCEEGWTGSLHFQSADMKIYLERLSDLPNVTQLVYVGTSTSFCYLRVIIPLLIFGLSPAGRYWNCSLGFHHFSWRLLLLKYLYRRLYDCTGTWYQITEE